MPAVQNLYMVLKHARNGSCSDLPMPSYSTIGLGIEVKGFDEKLPVAAGRPRALEEIWVQEHQKLSGGASVRIEGSPFENCHIPNSGHRPKSKSLLLDPRLRPPRSHGRSRRELAKRADLATLKSYAPKERRLRREEFQLI